MATETLNANGVASAGSWTVTITDIDEAIADADGNSASTTTDDDVLDLDLDASAVKDDDTVTAIALVARLKRTGTDGTDLVLIELLINGSPVEGANSLALTESFLNYTITGGALGNDRSASDMDGAQIRLTSVTQGMPHSPNIQVDCVDVIVTYDLGGVVVVPLLMAQYQPG